MGSKTWFWYDNWHSLSPLYATFNGSRTLGTGIPLISRVAKIINGTSWTWRSSRASAMNLVQEGLKYMIPDDGREVLWCPEGRGVFTISSACNSMRKKRD